MKTKGFKTVIIALMGFFLSVQAYPQSSDTGDWQNNQECLKNLSLYYEFFKHKNYVDAVGPWREVYRICPESRESLYAYGITIYRDFLEKAKDPAVESAYADTIMMIYDKRIEYFPDNKGDVLGRKGVDLLRYQRQEGMEFIQQGYDILKESIEIEKEKSSPVVLTTFISAGITLFLNDQLDGESVINDYVLANGILEEQIAKKPSATAKKAIEAIETNVKESRVMNCESIDKIFAPKFEANKDDKNWIKLVIGFMDDADCGASDLYANTSEKLYEMEPSAEAAYNLGRLFFKKENYSKAKDYYAEAIEKSTDDESKANYYYELGVIELNYLSNHQNAAQHAIEASKLKPDWGEPYILLGTSYASGSTNFSDDFEKRAVYWVVVDMFQKAKAVDTSVTDKANGLISEYNNYFPNKEDLFFRSIAEGSNYTVGGWIGKTTKARAKN